MAMQSNNAQKSCNPTRRSYLVTYSKVDLINFPSGESIDKAVVEAFHSGKIKVVVDYLACCLEEHENTSGQY